MSWSWITVDGPTPTTTSVASCRAVAGLPSDERSSVSRPTSMSVVSCPPTGRLGLLQPPQPPASALGMFQPIAGSISSATRNFIV
jgi:hypothetical protein